uniref:hypothetical protein n=1 Tax=Microzonia abyssicola TaxID=217214 RepID=UPI002E79945A|nr:hypothetical protein V2497_pgp019 [Syringoderma abyssicola]WAM65070.1 hypothetical protein [Syringoderma abyssicola]
MIIDSIDSVSWIHLAQDNLEEGLEYIGGLVNIEDIGKVGTFGTGEDFDLKAYLNLFIFFLRVAFRLYYWILTLRMTMQWFPNINPYIHPMYALLYATDFFLESFEGLLPTVLGMDMATMCAFTCLEWMIRTVDSIYFY